MASKKKSRMQWYRADLHLHTPASEDYQEPDVAYIEILRKAEQRGLDIIAITDHNTVNGYAAMMREVEQLSYLERLGRAQAEELRLLAEYRRLLDKVLVLPGFEFTATFGFHILAIFPQTTPLRLLEHILLSLNVPLEAIESGNSIVGASADVLTAYRLINEAGGIVIAAHANSAHGVAMRGMDFGGQTRIAYTQDRYLHALELTDLGRRGRGSTQSFFDGTKPEYPRRMRSIQGSDAHRINGIGSGTKNPQLGVGERITEFQLGERSFEALLDLFRSTDFSRSRPYNPNRQPIDYVLMARDEGASLVQSFHETLEKKGGKLEAIIEDVCAFANTNGGTIYVGISPDKDKKPLGIDKPSEAINLLASEISRRITPILEVEMNTVETGGKTVVQMQVPFGEDRPYAIDDNKIYVRDEVETTLAVRDEIVNLVRQGFIFHEAQTASTPVPVVMTTPSLPSVPSNPSELHTVGADPPADTPASPLPNAPRAGVEIVGTETRGGTTYFMMRDLRNGNIVKNVTRSSARRLWHYAIKQYDENPVAVEKVDWHGAVGLWRRYGRGGGVRYDLVQREGNDLRVYYGVSEGGMHGHWAQFLEPEEAEA